MWTFTFAAVLDVKATRKRWNHLLTLLKRRWPKLAGLRVFELHKSHGLHVHLVTNRWIDVNVARELAFMAGWGRIHVMRIPPERASYLAKYLSKGAPGMLQRLASMGRVRRLGLDEGEGRGFRFALLPHLPGVQRGVLLGPETRISGIVCGWCNGWKFARSQKAGRRG